jgi:hypothetical protein
MASNNNNIKHKLEEAKTSMARKGYGSLMTMAAVMTPPTHSMNIRRRRSPQRNHR